MLAQELDGVVVNSLATAVFSSAAFAAGEPTLGMLILAMTGFALAGALCIERRWINRA